MSGKRLVLTALLACACDRAPGTLVSAGIISGPSCDQQVDNAVIAANAANATAQGGLGPSGSSGAVLGFGWGTPADNSAVDQLVYQFTQANLATFTPPTGGTPFSFFTPQGSSFSVTYRGQLAFARSYGYADPGQGFYTEPDSRFRVASVSKPITAMGILKLVHDGVITLDYQPFADSTFLNAVGGKPAGAYDSKCPQDSPAVFIVDGGCGGMNPELKQITVSDLLYHAGGWDRDDPIDGLPKSNDSPDPMAGWLQMPGGPIDTYLGIAGPPTCAQTIQYFLSQPLQHPPGTVSHYSNFGFCVLGQILAAKGGTSYEAWLDTNVLGPLGMDDTQLGYALESERLDREVTYFNNDPNEPPLPSVFGTGNARRQYGGDGYFEALEGAGSLVSSAIDLALFQSSIETPDKLLFPATGTVTPDWPAQYKTLTETEASYDYWMWQTVCHPPPLGCISAQVVAPTWFGLGWDAIVPITGTSKSDWYKNGGLIGTATEIVLHHDGWTVTGLFNSNWPPDECDLSNGCTIPTSTDPIWKAGGYSPDQLLWNIYWFVTNGTTDYFPEFASPYGAWQSLSDFQTTLSSAKTGGQYPSRIDGKTITQTIYPHCTTPPDTCPPPTTTVTQRYRARLGSQPTTPVENLACDEMVAALAPGANGPLVSLQKFLDSNTNTWRYQAVFASP